MSSTRKAGTLYKEPDENEFEDNDDDEEEEENASITDTKHENGADEKEEDEDEDEDMDEDEFVVEKIFSHYIAADVSFALLRTGLEGEKSRFGKQVGLTRFHIGKTAFRGQVGRI